ncbi:hypothetical protein RFI_38429, partial [Reticulomyxa filosa]
EQNIKLENNKWRDFKFGVYLLGDYNILTVNCDLDMGHLKLKTSHLWIAKTCYISCSKLGYPSEKGPGKGENGSKELRGGGGASYGTKGRTFNFVNSHGKNGQLYGENTLLKEIHFGSGGGRAKYKSYPLKGGNGGGIIEIIVQQQIINDGCIECDGDCGICMSYLGGLKNVGAGGGSGGSILIVVQAPSNVPQKFGVINCLGRGRAGHGRIAIYTRCNMRYRSISAMPSCYLSSLIPKEEFIMKRDRNVLQTSNN